MDTKEYTSNIHCNSCIAKVAPHFDAAEDIDFWAVNLEDPQHTLTVEGSITPTAMQALAEKAGYTVALKG